MHQLSMRQSEVLRISNAGAGPRQEVASISVGLITGLLETVNGNTCIVVFVDRMSKVVNFDAAPTNTGALECIKLSRINVMKLHGMHDQDACWKGKLWTELCELWGVTQSMSTPYQPQTDGQTEGLTGLLRR